MSIFPIGPWNFCGPIARSMAPTPDFFSPTKRRPYQHGYPGTRLQEGAPKAASTNRPPSIPCAIRTPPIFWKTARISGSSRICSAIAALDHRHLYPCDRQDHHSSSCQPQRDDGQISSHDRTGGGRKKHGPEYLEKFGDRMPQTTSGRSPPLPPAGQRRWVDIWRNATNTAATSIMPIIPARTAVVPSAMAPTPKGGLRNGRRNYCPFPTSIWSSPCRRNCGKSCAATRKRSTPSSLRQR